MSSREPAEFENFYWEGGEDGDACYSENLAVKYIWPIFESVKDKLATAVGKSNDSNRYIRKYYFFPFSSSRKNGYRVYNFPHNEKTKNDE